MRPLSLAALLLASVTVHAAESLDEVQVIEQPGPRMWRVSKDDHELWIIGIVSPTPVDLQWNSRQVRAVMKEADEVLVPSGYGIRLKGNLFTAMRYGPRIAKLQYNPDGAVLRDLLPPEQYVRWVKLYSEAYGKPPGDDQTVRPMFLAEALYERTLSSRNLTRRDTVWPTLIVIAKETGVPVLHREFMEELKTVDMKTLMTEFRDLPREAEIKCLIETMDHIEQQVPRIDEQARAWAVGDPALLQTSMEWTSRKPCILGPMLESSLQGRLQAKAEQGREYWRGIVSYALLSKKTTVTLIPIPELIDSDGLFDYLRAIGYLIESPR